MAALKDVPDRTEDRLASRARFISNTHVYCVSRPCLSLHPHRVCETTVTGLLMLFQDCKVELHTSKRLHNINSRGPIGAYFTSKNLNSQSCRILAGDEIKQLKAWSQTVHCVLFNLSSTKPVYKTDPRSKIWRETNTEQIKMNIQLTFKLLKGSS